MVRLGEVVPGFSADSSTGQLDWHAYIDNSWAVLFSHPADFTPVCTTELGTVASLAEQFASRGVKLAALSCEGADSHRRWIKDIEAADWAKGAKVDFPIIADPDREIATKYGMLDPEEKDAAGLPMACRAVFVVKPDKTLALSILYPATTGRNFAEVLRVIDSMQMTASHKVATPADWQKGSMCMVVPSLSQAEAAELFANTGGVVPIPVPSGKWYLRMTKDPKN